jgi:Flp pilus assembly protein TadG
MRRKSIGNPFLVRLPATRSGSPSRRVVGGRARRRGTVAVFLALSATVLLGVAALAVDYGVLLADQNHAQRAVDAAALAGAAQLKSDGDALDMDNARRIAIATAATNGVAVAPNGVSFAKDTTQIRVFTTLSRQLFFAKAVGISTGHVSAAAVAEVVPADKPTDINVVPIGITWNTYLSHTKPLDTRPQILTLIRQSETVYDLNKFVVFDLRTNNAKSPSQMVDQLINPDKEPVQLGQMETTLNASAGTVGSKFQEAMSTMFQRSAAPPWNDTWTGDLFASTGIRYNEILLKTARRDNPRVMYFVINPDNVTSSTGSFDTPIQGFAPVYVESFQQGIATDGSSVTQLVVHFLPPTTGSERDGRNTGAAFSGVRSVRLVD